jgi:nucleoside-diphosphate-sugar epimerase
MMRVAILGADGFIGRAVARALAAAGWATLVPIDAQADAALADLDAVVNCLQGKPRSIAAGARALYSAAGRLGDPPLIVQLSSMSVYGTARGAVGEDAPLLADLGAYCEAQAGAEALAAGYPRAVILRPGCEYGPGGEVWSGRIARLLIARRLGDLGSAGDGICNLVYIDDLVAAVLHVLQERSAVGAVFNLAMPDPPSWNEYFVRFGRALGAVPVRRISRRRLAVETRLLAAPLRLGEIAARAAGLGRWAPPAIPPSLLRLCAQEIRLVPERARRELDWTSTPLEAGLARTAAWYRDIRVRSGG